MNFNVEGEFITDWARKWFYLENQPYKKVEDLLLSCMCGTDISLKVLKSYCEDILTFKRKFIGNTKDDSFCLVEDNDPLPDYIKIKNIDELFLNIKYNKKMFERYGFIDPKGNFYAVDWCKHHKWAENYLQDKYTIIERMKLSNGGKYIGSDFLVNILGWALLDSPHQGKSILQIGKPLTKAQRETLYDYYMYFNRTEEALDLYKEENL